MRFFLIIYFTFLSVTFAQVEVTCNDLQENKLIDFFNKDIKDKIIKVTPSFCLNKDSKYKPKDLFDKIFLNLKNNKKTENPSETGEPKGTIAFNMFKNLLLLRLWPNLSNQEKHLSFGDENCSSLSSINLNLIGFKDEKTDSTKKNYFDIYKKICSLKPSEPEKILPYLDKSIILEFFYIAKTAGWNFDFYQNYFCELVSKNNTILGSKFNDSKFDYVNFKRNVDLFLNDNRNGYEPRSTYSTLLENAKIPEIDKKYHAVIQDYTGIGDRTINPCVENPPTNFFTEFFSSCSSKKIDHLKNMVKSVNGKEMITFRGVKYLPESIKKNLNLKCAIKIKTFLSTSQNLHIAQLFGWNIPNGYILVIRGKSGANIRNVSYHKREEEVLYSPETRFIIIHEEKIGAFDNIYLKEVNPEDKIEDCP
ncbi:MAG: ADP-ribosyltransferase domain-containing protein [Bacteriovoracaceae bacterium]